MEHIILVETRNYSICKYQGIPNEAVPFLESVAWGSEGTLYRHTNIREHLYSIENPIFFTLWKDGRIQATTLISKRKISAGQQQYNCYYFRYFAIAPALKGSGIMPRYSRQILESMKDEEKEKSVFFSCVEKQNKNSFRVTELAGLKKTASFKTIGFSRFFPKWDPRIEPVRTGDQKNEVLELLKEFYRNHAFVQFHPVFRDDRYYVIRENNEILAGCQYHRVHWTVKSLPGIKGKWIMKLVPLLPLVNKLFHPRRFKFLALEAIYFKKGHESDLKKLISGLLVKEKLNTALSWMGSGCPHRDAIVKKGGLGLFHQFVKNSDGFIMTATKNLAADEVTSFATLPVYVSAFDNI